MIAPFSRFYKKIWATFKTWTQTLKTWTQKKQDPEKARPLKTWILKNLDPKMYV